MIENDEPIQDVAHLGRVELLTPRPVKSLWYFHELLGMEVVHGCGHWFSCADMAITPPQP